MVNLQGIEPVRSKSMGLDNDLELQTRNFATRKVQTSVTFSDGHILSQNWIQLEKNWAQLWSSEFSPKHVEQNCDSFTNLYLQVCNYIYQSLSTFTSP